MRIPHPHLKTVDGALPNLGVPREILRAPLQHLPYRAAPLRRQQPLVTASPSHLDPAGSATVGLQSGPDAEAKLRQTPTFSGGVGITLSQADGEKGVKDINGWTWLGIEHQAACPVRWHPTSGTPLPRRKQLDGLRDLLVPLQGIHGPFRSRTSASLPCLERTIQADSIDRQRHLASPDHHDYLP